MAAGWEKLAPQLAQSNLRRVKLVAGYAVYLSQLVKLDGYTGRRYVTLRVADVVNFFRLR